MEIVLANPRGFCAGVDRAIEIVERALERLGAPIYVRHEVVHNKFVVDNLRSRGAVFVDDLDEVPDDSIVIFSAHGVSKAVQAEAERRGLRVFDATCPLVTKVHLEVEKSNSSEREVILIGHAGHPEVEGTMGQYETEGDTAAGDPGSGIYLVENPEDVARLEVKDPDNLAFVTQTTLSVDDTNDVIDALRARFPSIIGPRKDDICYATQNRQDAVKSLADECDVVLVVGSPNSSNSNRLVELAIKRGRPAHLLDDPVQIQPAWLDGVSTIGITAGASAPEALVERVIDRLRELGVESVRELDGKREKVFFPLPKALQ